MQDCLQEKHCSPSQTFVINHILLTSQNVVVSRKMSGRVDLEKGQVDAVEGVGGQLFAQYEMEMQMTLPPRKPFLALVIFPGRLTARPSAHFPRGLPTPPPPAVALLHFAARKNSVGCRVLAALAVRTASWTIPSVSLAAIHHWPNHQPGLPRPPGPPGPPPPGPSADGQPAQPVNWDQTRSPRWRHCSQNVKPSLRV